MRRIFGGNRQQHKHGLRVSSLIQYIYFRNACVDNTIASAANGGWIGPTAQATDF
jgi:hypothetical protein